MLFRLFVFATLFFFAACGSSQNNEVVDGRSNTNDSTVACNASFIYIESFCGAEEKHEEKGILPLIDCPLALVSSSRHDTMRIVTGAKGTAQFRVKPGVYGIYLSRPGNPNILNERTCDWWFKHCFATMTVTSGGTTKKSFLLTFPCYSCK